MSTITPLNDDQIIPRVAEIFTGVKASMGKVPNMLRVLANAPAAVDVYIDSKASLHGGVLTPQAQEQIAIAIAAANGCDYCLAAHTGGARAAGVSTEDRAAAQKGHASDSKVQAILDLARDINATHGQSAAPALETARAFGLSDAEILETIAHVAINIMTNSVNNIVGTVLDFPKVERLA